MFQVVTKVLLLLVVFVPVAFGDITLNSPNNSSLHLTAASDFATDVLGDPWDFNAATDLADYYKPADYSGITEPVFSNGMMSFQMTSGGGFFYLLSPGVDGTNALGKNGYNVQIDTTKYHVLSIRMFSTSSASLRILYNRKKNYFEDFCHSVPVNVSPGWNTYVIDMNSLGCAQTQGYAPAWNMAPVTGLRIDPNSVAGSSVIIDSISLSANAPGDSHTFDYNFVVNGKRASFFLDDDQNPYNGVVRDLGVNLGSYTPISIAAEYLAPGPYYVYGYEANDFATLHRDPWDMSNAEDIFAIDGVNASFSGGTYSGVTTTGTSALYLRQFGKQIDPSIFRYFSMSLTTNGSGSAIVVWYSPTGVFLGQEFITVNPGSAVYTFDLGTNGSWSSPVGIFRVTPINVQGVNFSIDWIALRANSSGSPDAPNSVVSAPAPLSVNSPPTIRFLQPDEAGGADFASTVLGNPWDFGDTNDIFKDHLGQFRVHNVINPRFLPNNVVNGVRGNYYCASNVNGDLDPYQISHATHDPAKVIDSSRFKNAEYRLWVDHYQEAVLGSVVRMIFQGERINGVDAPYYNSQDQITKEGWQTYVQPLDEIELEPEQHPPGSYPAHPWTAGGKVTYFRIDPHEFTPSVQFCFDHIKVRAYDESNTKFAIAYSGVDADDPQSDISINFFYNSSKSTTGGTLIGSAHLSDPTRVIMWDTTNVPDGTYWIYGNVTDGTNTTSQIAGGRIVVNHQLPQDLTAPELVVENPAPSANVYDQLALGGFSVDNIQLALVEVVVDSTLVHTFIPNRYHPGAYAQFSSFSEGSTAGFFEQIPISYVNPGPHTLTVRAVDTGGNQKVVQIPFTKVGGADPAPYTPSEPADAAPTDIPPYSAPGPEGRVSLSFTASLDRKKQIVKMNVSGGASCSSLALIASHLKADATKGSGKIVTLRRSAGAASVSITSKKFTKKTKAPVFFAWTCNGVVASPVRSISFSKVKGGAVKTTASFISSEVRKRIR